MPEYTLKNIEVSNFKSFESMKADLGKLNVLIGANASGKSNFVAIFRFLKDISLHGLDDAIVMHGGVESVRNMRIGSSRDLTIKVQMALSPKTAQFPIRFRRKKGTTLANLDITEITYEFSIRFFKRKLGYKVRGERIDSQFRVTEFDRSKKKGAHLESRIILEDCGVTMKIDEFGKFEMKFSPEEMTPNSEEIFPFMRIRKYGPRIQKVRYGKELLLLGPTVLGEPENIRDMTFYSPFSSIVRNYFGKFALYDVDPRLSKKSMFIAGKAELASDGSNLPIVLHNILRSKRNRRRLAHLLSDLLPFIEDVDVEKLADRSFLTCLRERFYRKKYLPAPFISDGTINVIALIVALYFEKNPIAILEEPERNIHPRLISRVMDMMKDVSTRFGKQLIVTTHNQTVVKSTGVENLLLIYRENDFSKVSRPSQQEHVINFLKNEIGIDELFAKNLLEA